MRRFALALVALSVFVAGAGAAGAATPAGKPIRIGLRLPAAGQVSAALLKIPLRRGKGPAAKAGRPAVGVQVVVEQSGSAPSGVSIVASAALEGNTLSTSFVLLHVLEGSGTASTAPYSYDTTLFRTLAGGLAPEGAGPRVTVDVFLFDRTSGMPLVSSSGAVCGRCSWTLAQSTRKTLLRLDNLIGPHPPGPDAVCRLGFGVVAAGGDPDGVSLNGFVVNAHTSPFDLSVFGFVPQAISSEVTAGGGDLACGKQSDAASALTAAVRSAPAAFQLTVGGAHAHGTGRSNVCALLSTTPAQAGAAFVVDVKEPDGSTAEQKGSLGGDGAATVPFLISQYGPYHFTATVTVGGAVGTAETDYTVGPAPGTSPACNAP